MHRNAVSMKASELTEPGYYWFTPDKGWPSIFDLQAGKPVMVYVVISYEDAPPPNACICFTREFLLDQNLGGDFVATMGGRIS